MGNEALRQVKTLYELKVRSLLCVPLLVADRVLGHLWIPRAQLYSSTKDTCRS